MILDQYARPIQEGRLSEAQEVRAPWPRHGARLRAGWDAVRTDDDDLKHHWKRADGLGPNAAATAEIRRRFKERARYEHKNNSYCHGMVSTLANDTIGTGARLQMQTEDTEFNRIVEGAYHSWANQIGLPAKLRMMRQAKAVDGESIGLQVTNRFIDSPVSLDFRVLESDYLSSPFGEESERNVDGVRTDKADRPYMYYLLDEHPGGLQSRGKFGTGRWYSSRRVTHYFNCDRAGQARGIPEIGPALPLFAQLRRYTLAVLGAAETAADIAGVITTDAGPDATPQGMDPFLPIEFERRALLTMPFGWKIQQLKAEQPVTAYAEFKREILNEIARTLNMPFNVAAGNSSDYNYASGRLDHQVYHRAIFVERQVIEHTILDPLFSAWLSEYLMAQGQRTDQVDLASHRWGWDAFRHVDPMKEANATIALWEAGLLNDDDYLIGEGRDPEDHYRKMQLQTERRTALKLPLPGVAQQSIQVEGQRRGPGRPANDDAED